MKTTAILSACLTIFVGCADSIQDPIPDAGDGGEPDAAVDGGQPDSGPDAGPDGGEPDGCLERPWFFDLDGDGYGSPGSVRAACDRPGPDYVSLGGDCMDENADVHPGQTLFFEEDRGDGSFDYDCSGAGDPLWDTRAQCEPWAEGWEQRCFEANQNGCQVWEPFPPDCGAIGRYQDTAFSCTNLPLRQRCR